MGGKGPLTRWECQYPFKAVIIADSEGRGLKEAPATVRSPNWSTDSKVQAEGWAVG